MQGLELTLTSWGYSDLFGDAKVALWYQDRLCGNTNSRGTTSPRYYTLVIHPRLYQHRNICLHMCTWMRMKQDSKLYKSFLQRNLIPLRWYIYSRLQGLTERVGITRLVTALSPTSVWIYPRIQVAKCLVSARLTIWPQKWCRPAPPW